MSIRIRCMIAPQIGDRFRLDQDGRLMTTYQGFPVFPASDDDPTIASWPVARVTYVGAHWNDQPSGTSGYHVEIEPEDQRNAAEKLIGTRITASSAIEGIRDYTVLRVSRADDGSWMAWSERADGHGEHLRASTSESLARRIMSLR